MENVRFTTSLQQRHNNSSHEEICYLHNRLCTTSAQPTHMGGTLPFKWVPLM